MKHFFLFALLLVGCAHRPFSGNHESQLLHLVIIGTNDFHGYLKPQIFEVSPGTRISQGGASTLAGHLRILQKKYGENLLILDAGDVFQGTLESNFFRGRSTLEFFNTIPYTAVAVGNHEFDYGTIREGDSDPQSAFKELLKWSKFPFLTANVRDKSKKVLWQNDKLKPSHLVQVNGIKVGLIGLTTLSSASKTSPKNTRNLEFENLYQATQRELSGLQKQGVEIVILVAHEGGTKKGEPLFELLSQLPSGSIDAVVSGHDHALVYEKVVDVPMIQSGTKGFYFGRIDLFFDPHTRELRSDLTRIATPQEVCLMWISSADTCERKKLQALLKEGKAVTPLRPATYEGEIIQSDELVEKTLSPFFAQTDLQRREVLGQATREFVIEHKSGLNEVGELFVEASFAQFPKARATVHNGGGIRKTLPMGPITYGDLYEMHPFDNKLVQLRMTGAQLKEMVRVLTSGAFPLPVLGGIRAELLKDQGMAVARDVNGDGKQEPWEADRLINLRWEKSGQPVKDKETFEMVTNDFLAAGGDGLEHVLGSLKTDQLVASDIWTRDFIATMLRKKSVKSLPPETPKRISFK